MDSNQTGGKPIPEENEVDIDDAEFDAKMDDEINSQLNKKFHDSVSKGKFDEEEEEGYSDDDQ